MKPLKAWKECHYLHTLVLTSPAEFFTLMNYLQTCCLTIEVSYFNILAMLMILIRLLYWQALKVSIPLDCIYFTGQIFITLVFLLSFSLAFLQKCFLLVTYWFIGYCSPKFTYVHLHHVIHVKMYQSFPIMIESSNN